MKRKLLGALIGVGAVFAIAGARNGFENRAPATIGFRQETAGRTVRAEPESSHRSAASSPPVRVREEIQACFPNVAAALSLSGLAADLKARRAFLPPDLLEENIELVTARNEKRIVQFLPSEADPVRVFSISDVDGFPDRVRDFPGRAAGIRARLAGALSLGRIVAVKRTDTWSTRGGAEMTLESNAGEVISLRFRDEGMDFDCTPERCFCARR